MSNRQMRRIMPESDPSPPESEEEFDGSIVSSVEAAFKELRVNSDEEDEDTGLSSSESFRHPARTYRPRKKNRSKKKTRQAVVLQDEAAAYPLTCDEVDEIPEETELIFLDMSEDGNLSPDLPNTFMEADLPTQSATMPQIEDVIIVHPEEIPSPSESLSEPTSSNHVSESELVSSLTVDTSYFQSVESLSHSIEFDAVENSTADDLFDVSMRLMRVTQEIRRFFGPEEAEPLPRRNWTGRERVRRRAMLVDIPHESVGPNYKGLSMSVQFTKEGIKYFAYDHTVEHQELHREFLENLATGGNRVVLNLENAKINTHVESLLEIFDTMCRREEMSSANKLIEHIMAILQYTSHPGFHLCNRRHRLPYRYVENRPYHICMLKYIYLLTNKACHRTALELAKVLYNLDPTDPLGMIILIDTLAIKARQYDWLLGVMEFWSEQRRASLYFNWLYSSALAFFHVVKHRGDCEERDQADSMLRAAILQFPSVVTALFRNMDCAAGRDLINHPYYSRFALDTTGPGLTQLIEVYARMTWSRWQETHVLSWFLNNAEHMAQRFDNDVGMETASRNLGEKRMRLYRRLPDAIIRHMCILRPMRHVILDGLDVPHVSGYAAFDPLPPQDEVDRYGYTLRAATDNTDGTSWCDWLKEGEVLFIDFENMPIFVEGYDYIHSHRCSPRPRTGTRWTAGRVHQSGARGGDDRRNRSGRGPRFLASKVPHMRGRYSNPHHRH